MKRRIVGFCFLLLFLLFSTFSFAVHAAGEEKVISFAIIPADNNRQPEDAIISKVETALSLNSQVPLRLLERSLIGKIINEQKLKGFSADKGNLTGIGGLVPADILIFLEKIPESDPGIYRLQFVEANTALVLATSLTANSSIGADVLDTLQTVVKKYRVPHDQRQYIGGRGQGHPPHLAAIHVVDPGWDHLVLHGRAMGLYRSRCPGQQR